MQNGETLKKVSDMIFKTEITIKPDTKIFFTIALISLKKDPGDDSCFAKCWDPVSISVLLSVLYLDEENIFYPFQRQE